MHSKLIIAAACVLGGLVAHPVLAQDNAALTQPGSVFDIVDEIRFGGAFHHAYPGFLPTNPSKFNFTQPEDISFDVLFRTPDADAFYWIGSPRPELGTIINLTGHESIVHLNLTWQARLPDFPVYLEGAFGGAINNGYTSGAPAGYQDMGCNIGFYERVGIGTDLPGNFTATLSYEHTSNAGLCSPNDGLSYVAFRMGMKF